MSVCVILKLLKMICVTGFVVIRFICVCNFVLRLAVSIKKCINLQSITTLPLNTVN